MILLQEYEPARGAVTAATLCTVAIAALADKHTCHSAQKRHQMPSLPVGFWNSVTHQTLISRQSVVQHHSMGCDVSFSAQAVSALLPPTSPSSPQNVHRRCSHALPTTAACVCSCLKPADKCLFAHPSGYHPCRPCLDASAPLTPAALAL